MISVDADYLAFLHDELAENQTRLREALGESAANAMFDWCADKLVRTAEKGKYSFHPIDAVVQRLSEWGIPIKVKETGGTTEVEVRCPYAQRIHPRLGSKIPRCPLGEYFLGAIRLEEEKAQLASSQLTPWGARFLIRTSSAYGKLWSLPLGPEKRPEEQEIETGGDIVPPVSTPVEQIEENGKRVNPID